MTASLTVYALAVAMLVGLCCGMLSPFVIVRRRSLLSDTIAHSTLPGVGFGFLLTENNSLFVVLVGAFLASLFAFLLISLLRRTKLGEDAVFASIMTTFFGAGLIAFSIVGKLQVGASAGLSRFLFGNLATIWVEEVAVFAVLALGVSTIVALYYRQLKLSSFDSKHAHSLYLPLQRWKLVFDFTLLFVVLLGLQIVGVVLIAAMLVGPGAAARQWAKTFAHFFMLSIFFALLAALSGVLFSARYAHLPPGPVIVLMLAAVVLGSFLKNIVVSKWNSWKISNKGKQKSTNGIF